MKARYTAAELADLASVPLRTVRYYIQQGLVDPPLGRGPGPHFTDRHLHQLQRTRSLQAIGLDIAAIKQYADELEAILKARGMSIEGATRAWAAYAMSGLAHGRALVQRAAAAERAAEAQGLKEDEDDDADDDDDDRLDPSDAIRVPMAPGVELWVRSDLPMPSPRRLVELALMIRKLFGDG